jgi:phospholipid/cholesterol/gamma-HCH transport system substrate-binding protein
MRRIALTFALLAGLAGTVVSVAGAGDSRSYQVELFNAFGIVKGSELRVAGAKAGTVTGLDITPQKTAMLTVSEDGSFPPFKSDASCSSEPQSLLAEYFLNCDPGTSTQELNGPIPAARNKTTVQPDLANNTLRMPFRQRLQLLINEFGTALDSNAGNLNAAIRAGAPALQQLKQVLNILGKQNHTIADLNLNADTIFQQLANRRQDVVNFIDNAGRTAAISAERSSDLSKNFDLLDNFLAELKPTMFQLGRVADANTPLLTDLQAAAPQLNLLGKRLPPFNRGAEQSLTALGRAGHVGKFALANSHEEIAALNQTSTKAAPAANQVATFLQSIDNPANATEEDACARWDLRELPGEADRRVQLLDQKLGTTLHGDQTVRCKWGNGSPAGSNPSGGNPGYTGMEGLLNYAYIQTNSLNLFDELGHALGITIVEFPGNPATQCGYQTGPTVSARGGGSTTNPLDYSECAGILGPNQPGINYGTNPSGLFGNLPPYDPSVCPEGSRVPQICDPNGAHTKAGLSTASPNPAQNPQQQQPIPNILQGVDPNKVKGDTEKKLKDLQNMPRLPGVPDVTQGLNPPSTSAPSGSSTNDLLNFLLGQ